ncbi:hypothetical protein B0H16DRAFT_1450083 [Mycena metata]|uniref:Uncharacterized protein n=1 Tax=Mycena metata TaxID=1033252 RepID=A0AAD7NUC6_9AGAR|nr:hypothetical protein B0H16DRAFT_1450083 [Mycena metata]
MTLGISILALVGFPFDSGWVRAFLVDSYGGRLEEGKAPVSGGSRVGDKELPQKSQVGARRKVTTGRVWWDGVSVAKVEVPDCKNSARRKGQAQIPRHLGTEAGGIVMAQKIRRGENVFASSRGSRLIWAAVQQRHTQILHSNAARRGRGEVLEPGFNLNAWGEYCSVPTISSRGVTRHRKSSLERKFTARQSANNCLTRPIWARKLIVTRHRLQLVQFTGRRHPSSELGIPTVPVKYRIRLRLYGLRNRTVRPLGGLFTVTV